MGAFVEGRWFTGTSTGQVNTSVTMKTDAAVVFDGVVVVEPLSARPTCHPRG